MQFITNLNKGILGKSDPVKLWQYITSYIPDEVLLREDLKILSPACGHATEVDVLVKRMLNLGRTTSEIKDSIYLVDKYSVFTKDAVRKGYTNVIQADFLNWNTDMKFDVIIGNPPYQSTDDTGERKSKSTNLWSRFTKKSFDMVKDGEYVVRVYSVSDEGVEIGNEEDVPPPHPQIMILSSGEITPFELKLKYLGDDDEFYYLLSAKDTIPLDREGPL